jgi:hypothetical protein
VLMKSFFRKEKPPVASYIGFSIPMAPWCAPPAMIVLEEMP